MTSPYPDGAATFTVTLTEREALALKIAAEHLDASLRARPAPGSPLNLAAPSALVAAEKVYAGYRAAG